MGTQIARTALLLHLLCTWYPFRWVIRLLLASNLLLSPARRGQREDQHDDHSNNNDDDECIAACLSVLNQCQRNEMELLVQFAQDFLVINFYFLYAAIVATSSTTHAVNRLCLAYSMATLVWLVASHNYFHPTPTVHEYNARFFKESVWCYSIGSLILFLVPGRPGSNAFQPTTTNTTRSRQHRTSMKWSIPANAIFCGAVRAGLIVFNNSLLASFIDSFISFILDDLDGYRSLNCLSPLRPCSGMPTGTPWRVTCAFGV
jgi:hypothetical protein